MSEQKPKLGKKGALKEVAKKLTELRKKPLSKKVFDIVQEISIVIRPTKKLQNQLATLRRRWLSGDMVSWIYY